MYQVDVVCDRSKEKLIAVPPNILKMTNLKMLFLEGNFLTSLPFEIFWKLRALKWLDLRNNLLEEIPISIAFHKNLEHILISNNNLRKLPNELGTVENLKSMQFSDNPLTYPIRPILAAGTQVIKNFLREQYEISLVKTDSDESLTSDGDSLDTEQIIEVTNIESEELDEQSPGPSKICSKVSRSPEEIRKQICDEQTSNPDLKVKQLLSPDNSKHRRDPDKAQIIHRVRRTGSTLYMKSYLNKTMKDGDSKKFNNLKEGWLNELRNLLAEQERIIQQEKNLQAISTWRLKMKSEAAIHPKSLLGGPLQPPYGTDPRYAKTLSREQFNKQFDEDDNVGSEHVYYSATDIQRMMRNLLEQVRDMQIAGSGTEQAELQIKTIMDIQKKLEVLKSINEKTL